MNKSEFLLAVTLVAAVVFAFAGCENRARSRAEAEQPGNVLTNGDFEQSEDGHPTGWRRQTWAGRAEFDYSSEGRSDGKCVMISSQSGADAAWHTTAKVRPFSKYRLSAWIKTEDLSAGSGKGALLNLHDMQPLQTPAVTGTSDWKKVELVFDAAESDSVRINCLFGGWGQSTGRVWFDDIRLDELEVRQLNPDVTIEAAKKGEPISKYVYGQFIEHLGRCIYGGIWAEMLEDRKFYYPLPATGEAWNITDAGARVLAASPWEVIGPDDTITMDTKNPYVGRHTPVVKLPGMQIPRGIAQPGLSITEGTEYAGRIVMAGDPLSGPVTISLAWGSSRWARSSETIYQLTPEYNGYPLHFKAGKTTDNARLEIVAQGRGELRIGVVSLMPADNVHGFRPDVLALMKELDAPVYRWPGGNFVSGYDWTDGIGARDRRPPRKNPAWTGVELNDVGIHEFIKLCELLGTEPLVVVNTGLGGAESAAQLVEYCNGSADTTQGQLRAQNGHPEPFDVKFWGVGNEMYGSWQLGHMPLSDYVKKHNRFAEAMRAVDSDIVLVAVGAVGEWSETMLRECADHMDLISEHFYNQERDGMLSHTAQPVRSTRRICDAHRDYRRRLDSLKGKDIRLAIDEWNYWYGPHVYGELGTRYFLKDALGVSRGLHEFLRNSDLIFMANYAQTVNVIGCIKATETAAEFATTGLALKLYRKRFGTVPVEISGEPAPLDVVAAWTEDGSALTLGVVNPLDSDQELPVDIVGAEPAGDVVAWILQGPGPMAYNEPGEDRRVEIVEKRIADFDGRLSVPAYSAGVYKLAVK